MTDEAAPAAAPRRPGRPGRDAEATRSAILKSAARCFASENYERVGLRAIAADAGVDAALIVRYFGSKEELLLAAVHSMVIPSTMLQGDKATFGARMAEMLTAEHPHDQGRDYFLLMLQAATVRSLLPRVRSIVDERLMKPFAAWLGGPDAPVRAKLILTVTTGASLQSLLSGSSSLTNEEARRYREVIAGLIQAYIDGP